VVQWYPNVVIVLAKEDVEVDLHAQRAMIVQFHLCEWGTVVLKNCIVVQK
jgi:hypothetical protein